MSRISPSDINMVDEKGTVLAFVMAKPCCIDDEETGGPFLPLAHNVAAPPINTDTAKPPPTQGMLKFEQQIPRKQEPHCRLECKITSRARSRRTGTRRSKRARSRKQKRKLNKSRKQRAAKQNRIDQVNLRGGKGNWDFSSLPDEEEKDNPRSGEKMRKQKKKKKARREQRSGKKVGISEEEFEVPETEEDYRWKKM